MAAYQAPTFTPPETGLADLRGVRAAGVSAGIKASGAPDVALLVFEQPVSAAGVFTQNRYAAAPVGLCRRHLAQTNGVVRALIANSGNANACTGDQGEQDALRMATEVAVRVGCDASQVLVFSTGIIGHVLPMPKVIAGIDLAYRTLACGTAASRAFATAIRTTDAFAKESSAAFEDGGRAYRVAGVAKGAGMIEPNMATMLAFLGTDFALPASQLRQTIQRIAAHSFNAVHVDSHASTNDSFIAFGLAEDSEGLATGSAFEAAALQVAKRLAWFIARDGEGATKVTTLTVVGDQSEADLRTIARSVVHSALVRTALFGCDPNWGRIVSAVGNSGVEFQPERLRCSIAGVAVFDGQPLVFDATAVSQAMRAEDLEVRIELGGQANRVSVMTSDLSYRYVEVNAEYTT